MAEIGSEAGTPERPADAIVCPVTSVIGVAGMPEFNSLKDGVAWHNGFSAP